MGTASAETHRSHKALADILAEPSRGHCRDGLLHCTHTHIRHPVLLFRYRPRPAANPSPQCDTQSQRPVGCIASDRNLGVWRAAAALPNLDRDSKFSADVVSTVQAMGTQ